MMKKRRARNLVLEQIEREREYLNSQEVGSEEYNASQKRLNDLNTMLGDLEDRNAKLSVDIIKWAGGTLISLGTLVFLTANEKEIVYTGSAKDFIRSLIPKKPY